MKILAIESSSLVASAAIVEDDILVAEYTVDYKVTHSQTLLPMIDEILRMTQTDKKTLDAIAVSGGPGSYTGLRIGSATAKGLGMALDIPLIHVPTLDAMAYNAYGYAGIVCPIMDARRSQVYAGIYKFENGRQNILMENSAITFDELMQKLDELNFHNDKIMFIGDGIPVFRESIDEHFGGAGYEFAPASMNRQRAASVAVLGQLYYKKGWTEPASEHLPDYLRLSQAERELNEKRNSNG